MLEDWKQHIEESQYNELVNFVQLTLCGVPLKDQLLIIYGGPSTGKSKLFENIKKIIGEENTDYAPNYAKCKISNELTKKLLVFKCEKSCNITGTIKQIVSRQPMRYKKLYNKEMMVVPTCNVILIISSLDDLDYGLVRRAKLVHLTKVFTSPKPCITSGFKSHNNPFATTNIANSSVTQSSNTTNLFGAIFSKQATPFTFENVSPSTGFGFGNTVGVNSTNITTQEDTKKRPLEPTHDSNETNPNKKQATETNNT